MELEEGGKKTGEIIEGITIRYLPNNELTPCEDTASKERGQISRGLKPAKLTLPIDKKDQLNVFPALYNVEIEMAVVADKLQARIKNIAFASEVKLVNVPAGA
jgi:CHAT domain-containing protein